MPPPTGGDFRYDEGRSLEAAGYWHGRGWWQGVRATAAIFFTAGMLVAWGIEGGTFGDCRAPKTESSP